MSSDSAMLPPPIVPPPPSAASTSAEGTETPPLPLPPVPLIVPSPAAAPPSRKIFSDVDLANWLDSEAYHYLELMIARLSVSVEGKNVEDPCHESPAVQKLTQFLGEMSDWIDAIPLQTSPQRFGNKSFRVWIAKMEEHEGQFQRGLVSPTQAPAVSELSGQFRSSFGSGPRLDYGTGHELSFLAYLTILRLVGVFEEADEQAMVTRVFVTYLALVRKLQKVFRLEPAGSKGVWGLDDHQHLSYLWGASQLRTHPSARPATILSPGSMSPLGVSNLFLSSILHINDIKSGPFAEHSPVLYNIATTVPNWAKVSTGLMRMYREEVLSKVPVVQHFRFGGVLSWTRVGGDGTVMPSSGDGAECPDEEETGFKRERDESTVAPWALPSLSGTTPPPPSPIRIPSGGSSPVPLMRQNSQGSLSPKPFVPPELFPHQRRASLLSHSVGSGISYMTVEAPTHTVADAGGAGATSSPFGVLSNPSLGVGRKEGGGVPWTEAEGKDGR